jgi:hypothetical protein
MTNSPGDAPRDFSFGDIVRPLVPRARHIRNGTILATIIGAILAGVYYVIQPTTRSASLGFRPVFDSAKAGRYPNGLPFAPTDILNPSIVNQVYAVNRVEQYCRLDAFRSGLTVQESSPELQFLTLEYQARLAATGLTAIDRERLQNEFVSRRAALQPQYDIVFLQPQECMAMPQPVVFKGLQDILETWATESEQKRGVLRFRVSVLSPRVFDFPNGDDSALVRADMLRTGVIRVISNIAAVERLPGSELIRGSDKNGSLAEVRGELEDLLQARLDPLIAIAGRGLGDASQRFLRQALQTAQIRLTAAQQRAEVYKQALREYSGMVPSASDRSTTDRAPSPSDLQTLTPQIDRTFIDRIVDLSTANTTFRQEVTRQAIDASVEAVDRATLVEQYRQLLASLGERGDQQAASENVVQILERVTAQAKDATRRFNEIYDEFTRVSLRPGPAMYSVERPASGSSVAAFTRRHFALTVLAVAIVTPILLALAFLLQYYSRKFINSLK